MSTQSPVADQPKPRTAGRTQGAQVVPEETTGLRIFDSALLLGFLALTFLLGVFPLKDTDFWWHLCTGDLIRQTGTIPSVDTYTFTVSGRPWIDLHWLFQVAISWLYERGGVPALTLAKCTITTFAVFLLVTAQRREWPLWASLLAWLPALLVLSGRMYVRPETLTLLYLSVYLAVLTRIDRIPALAFVLPVVQVAWVNTQGLFVFGPILLGCALVDCLLRPSSLAHGRKRWWSTIGIATALTGLACLVNPYGLTGALYPLELAGTMSNPIFTHSIAELTPIPEFIKKDAFVSLPFRLHIVTMALGALSFLVPLVWVVFDRFRRTAIVQAEQATTPAKREKGRGKPGKAKRSARKPVEPEFREAGWRPSLFRLLLFGAFCYLSWQATRNSHQFAAVVGAVTAWNFAEWAAAARRRAEGRPDASRGSSGVFPRVVALTAIAGVFVWVASGRFYEASREGRTIGLGEQPLWYPHEAVKFCGAPGMPDRFLGYHIGHASLYEYYFAPERKVYADARLEVIGPDLFERYMDLQKRITRNESGWERELDVMQRPAVLVDFENDSPLAASLLTSPDWRCVWFDAVAAVFVHESFAEVVSKYEVDFAARHFRPEPATDPSGTGALTASAKALSNLASAIVGNAPGRALPLLLLGMDHARRLRQADPNGSTGWKLTGLMEMLCKPRMPPVARCRFPFDPIFDLSLVRATYALRHAAEVAPDDFTTQLMLKTAYEFRMMSEAELNVLDRLVTLTPINAIQRKTLQEAEARRQEIRNGLGPPPPARWENLNDLSQIVNGLIASGRVALAADYLENAAPSDARTWEETDRIASLRLHLGETDRARTLWQGAKEPPRPGLREARMAFTHFVEGDFEAARQAFHAAIALNPDLFEAHYGLAVLEQDAGRAAEALNAARKAVSIAPSDVARNAAQGIVAVVTPYAHSRLAE